MRVNQVVSSVRNSLIPDRKYEKEVAHRVSKILKKIHASVKDADACLGGSGAKGTWLKTFDVDIFVKFPYIKYKDKGNNLSDILEKGLKKKFKQVKRLHGSRDYFQLSQEGFTFEVIPILKISKAAQAKNITDVSPLHSQWVKKHKKLVNEMRLTKQFCKANNLYGAESYIRGFSGYVCEIITVQYGSFLSLLKAAKKWKKGTVIDVQNYYKGKNVFLEMNKSKLVSPLIVVDPVQHDRNAAAALDEEKFFLFKKRSMEFLKKPAPDFFEEAHLHKDKLKEEHKGKKILLIHLTPLKGKDDVVGSKMMKVYELLENKLRKSDFLILESNWYWARKGEALLYFIFDNKPLSNVVECVGPSEKMKGHASAFKRKHKNTRLVKGKLIAKEKRKFVLPEKLILQILKEDYVKRRVSKARLEML